MVQASGPAPVAIGDRIAGSFDDATGHSAQSHLVYAANSRVWWLFTLTSDADSEGGSNHVVKSFRSSGPDLATATWTAGADSPPLAAGSPNQFMGGGRSLGVAYLNNNPIDVIHADVSMAFDGQDGRTGHIRAVVTGSSIAWASWNIFDEPAATWTRPRANTIGVSSGKFIHTGGPILQQEVDANARKSTNADTGSTWTSGFSVPAVIDGSMVNQDNALAFAPLANNVMLAVYDNGQGIEPNQTNLRYKRSNTNGTWSGIVVGSQTGGDGNVFPTSATIDQNDWGLVSVSTSKIYVFRRNAKASGIDAASYDVVTNSWSAMSPAPPAFGTGQSFKSGAGLFGTTDGSNVWVCVVNTDLANSILCARFDGTAWTSWSSVPGTDVGIQNRNYISGSPQVGSNQIGLIWTEGTSLFDVVAMSFSAVAAAPDVKAPTVSLTAPADGATVSGTISISATASDEVGVASVQFRLDGVDLGIGLTAAPYTIPWNTTTAANGAHVLTAIARDEAGNSATASAVSVTVANDVNVVPNVIGLTRTEATASIVAAGLTLGTVTETSSATVPSGSVISQSPSGGTKVAANSAVNLIVSSGPATVGVPNVAGFTEAAATTAITDAGLALGAITTSSSATVPAGSVISQTPAGGTQVAIGSAVSFVVSSGAPQVAVPSVVGLTQAAAAGAIAGADLKLGVVTTASSTTVPAGSVISQTPAAGTQVASGTAVALVVSSGPLKVAVPNVVGLTQAAATTAISNAGLIVGSVTTALSTTVPPGSVISQDPAAGSGIPATSPVDLVVSSGPGAGTPAGTGAIGINFVGKSATLMRPAEIAGVIAQPNWNNAIGTGAASVLPLVDETGVSTNATVRWSAAALWLTQITDAAGNRRMMKGYLNTNTTPGTPSTTTATVSGLTPRAYDVYVYTDGDNRGDLRSASYIISGPDITTETVTVTDPINTDFTGTFTRADNSNGNYVKFSITAAGFTISATPVSSVAGTLRAPLNGIQIVPTAAAPPDFTIAATPATQTVLPGESISYTATVTALNELAGPVTLAVTGAPEGISATFTPASVSGTGDATLGITTSPSMPPGSWPLMISGTSGSVTHTASVTLVVPQPAIGVKFLGSNPAIMDAGDIAGVVPQTHWNNAAGSTRSTPLALVDASGRLSTATATWNASGLWMVGIVDQPGNPRLMKGYLDNNNTSVTTVTVSGLPPGDYDVYVYCDGDNKAYYRTASYEISGTGITPTSIQVTDLPNVNFTGTFTEAADSNGNYVKFTINGTRFTITARPGTSTNVNVRAPINGIQIVSRSMP